MHAFDLYSIDKKTGLEWMQHFGDVIMDPDGWRAREISFDEPLTYPEYMECVTESTIKFSNNLTVRLENFHQLKSLSNKHAGEIFECVEDDVGPEHFKKAGKEGRLQSGQRGFWTNMRPEDYTYLRNNVTYRINPFMP